MCREREIETGRERKKRARDKIKTSHLVVPDSVKVFRVSFVAQYTLNGNKKTKTPYEMGKWATDRENDGAQNEYVEQWNRVKEP